MRLIDADAFIEYLGLDEENAREDNLGEIVTLEDFDRQPTAYDVDRVVGELKTDSSVKLYGSNNSGNYLISVDRAVEIVKQGGVDNGY